MLPKTPFDQFIGPRLNGLRDRLAKLVWHPAGTLETFEKTASTAQHVPAETAVGLVYEPVAPLPMVWGRKFEQCWWRVHLPEAARDGKHYLVWHDQAEATTYTPADGGLRAHAGIDPGHTHCRLPADIDTLYIESCCMRTGIWVPGARQGTSPRGSEFRGADLVTRDDEMYGAYHDLSVLLDTAALLYQPPSSTVRGGIYHPDILNPGGFREPVRDASPLFRQLMQHLDRAADAYDTEGVQAFRAKLAEIYANFKAEAWQIGATLTGHAHLDLVWLWPEKVGEFKAVHTFANALHLGESYPEMVFGYTQPASYQAVGKRAPEVIERVKASTADGKWEPTGAMWVESDVQLPCGEALVRAVELGQKGLAKYRGGSQSPASRVLWIPDVFGYSPCIPQILAGFGVPYFFTTKLHWSSATQFPHSSFKWVGHDGSEILAHICWSHYNNRCEPEEIKYFAHTHRNSGVHADMLVPTGFGDGGGGPTDDMCERARRLADLSSMPKVRWGGIEDFFDRMAEVRDDLPSWQGEMYLEYHRGVQTTHGNIKHAYRRAERALRDHEAVRCLTGGAVDEPSWERVCFAQFHDALPGSSIFEVYAEQVPELNGIADRHEQAAADELAGDGDPCVFNPLATECLAKIDGETFKLPPLAGVALDSAERVTDGVTRDGMTLHNGRVSATFTDDGRIAALEVDGQAIPIAEPLGRLYWFHDLPARYDAWDIDRATVSNPLPIEGAIRVESTDDAIAFTRTVGDGSTVTLRYTLRPGGSVLEVTADVDWHETAALLKIAFPTQYAGKNARYGAPFGSTLRAQQPGGIAEDAVFEAPGSRWAFVADDGEREGLMLLTESKYGFGCHRGTLHLSLLRSAYVTSADETRAIRDLPDGPSGSFSDLGKHTIRFAVGRFDTDAPRADQPAAMCDAVFAKPIRYTGQPARVGLQGIDGGDSLVPVWTRPTDDGFILRLNETLGRRGTAVLRLDDGLRAEFVDLRGESLAPCDGTVDFTPYQLVSVRVRR